MYATVVIPCSCAEAQHEKTISLLTSPLDRQRDFNRSETLRAFPKGDPTYRRVYKQARAEIESVNSEVQGQLWNGRSRTKGRAGTLLEVLAMSFLTNATTRHVYGPAPDAEGSPAVRAA